MRDGWLVQEDLGYQHDLLLEEALALRLLDEVKNVSSTDLHTVRASLTAIAAHARRLVLWIEGVMFANPSVVLVTGAPSAGKTSLIDHLLSPDAIYASKTASDLITHTITVYGYQRKGTARYRDVDGGTSMVSLAEYVQQSQQAGAIGEPGFVGDRAIWPLYRVQMIETSNADLARGGWASCSLNGVDVVMYVVDARPGRLSATDALALHEIRALQPRAVIHIVFTKVDTVSEGCLSRAMQECERQRHLFDGAILVYSAAQSAGLTQSRCREAMARMLWRSAVEQEDQQTQRYKNLVTEHILHRRRLHASLTEFTGTMLAEEPGKSDKEATYGTAMSGALEPFLNEYGQLDMRLP